MTGTASALPRSGKFLPPGRLLPTPRLDEVRRLLGDALGGLDLGGRPPRPADDRPGEFLLDLDGLSLPECCDRAEGLLKSLLSLLSADLIGGSNVTRLDRALALGHPRLPYRRALRIVAGRGWRLPLGEDLTPDAQASLIRACGLLPVQVLYLPGQPQPASRPSATQGLVYLAPWGGCVLDATLPAAGAREEAGGRLSLDRLLQFALGLADGLV